NIGYGANDHAATIDDGTTTVAETLAPGGRVLERKVTDDTTHNLSEDTLYGYAGFGDSPAYTRAAAGGAVTSYLGACVDVAGTATWQIRNGHGDVVGTTDAAGGYSANPATDEFGVGTAPASRLGYLGGAERFTTDTNLGIIRMGARLYDPSLGRFLQTDPIPGGSANNYDYANQDPINGFDLGGDISFCSDDYCDAAQALHKAGNEEALLERSSDFYNNNQDLRENNKIRNAAYYGKTTYWHAASETLGLAGTVLAIAGVGASGIAEIPADVAVLGTIGSINTGISFGSAFANRADKGWITVKCGGGWLAFGASVTTAGIANKATEPELRSAGHALGLAWNNISQLVGR
ncbi:MAG: hypothetical protein QOF30_1106, partial [Acidimicrobiaceae bacterium]|nr:hypothetical protein [Acidimicrobiaceae bacterium]